MKLLSLSAILFVLLALQSCVSKQNIQSFECKYAQNGNDRTSESIILKPEIMTVNGVSLTPQDPNSTQVFARYDNRTSKTLKEYKIEVEGGSRIGNTAIIIVDTWTEAINKRLQVIVTVKKDPSFADTIDYIVDYKGTLNLNFDAHGNGGHAQDVFVDVHKVEDSAYYSHFKCDLFKVDVTCGDESKSYYVSEDDASVFVSNKGANGANGHNGKNGAKGAPGRDGADGFKGKDGERGGDGTDGGNGSNGGNGGKVVVTMDQDSEDFRRLIRYNNKGGNGGLGGKGGVGGAGGAGGLGGQRLVGGKVLGERKASGETGASGSNGRDGRNGAPGQDGEPIKFIVR
jgi:hypothetical protein